MKIKFDKRKVMIVLGIFTILFMFYWVFMRPAVVRRKCYKRTLDYYPTLNGSQRFYDKCFMDNFVKPEEL